MTEKQHNLIVRTLTGVCFVAIMVAGFLRPEGLILLFATITGLTMWEYTGLVNNIEGVTINRGISTAAGVYFFLAVAGMRTGIVPGLIAFMPYLLTIIYLFVSELYLKHTNPIADWAYTMFGQMYVALPLSLINILAFQLMPITYLPTYDMLLPLSVFIFLWLNDTGAYCVGSLIGKLKLFPRISPGKTWEGSIGGGIVVLIISAVIGYVANRQPDGHLLSLPQWMGLGLVVVVFGTWGDLVESLFKRTLGIKDSGNMLPGHGGMLDRFDSSLLAIPASVVYLYTLTLL